MDSERKLDLVGILNGQRQKIPSNLKIIGKNKKITEKRKILLEINTLVEILNFRLVRSF